MVSKPGLLDEGAYWHPTISKVEGGFTASLESPLYNTREQAEYAMDILLDAMTKSSGATRDDTRH